MLIKYEAAMPMRTQPHTASSSPVRMSNWKDTLNENPLSSPFTPVELPAKTIVERILDSLEDCSNSRPYQAAVTEGFGEGKSITYGQLRAKSLSMAAFLQSRSFAVGEKATMIMPNCVELPIFTLGVWAAGGAVVGSSIAFKTYETRTQLTDSKSSVVITTENLLGTVLEAVKGCESVKTVICVRRSAHFELPESVVDFDDVTRSPPLKERRAVSPDSPALVFYTSGTTGTPKGVVHTQRTFHAGIEQLRSHWEHEIFPKLTDEAVDWSEETQLVLIPCYHLMGLTLLNWFLMVGSPVVLLQTFRGGALTNAISKFKPRFILGHAAMVKFLTADENADLTSVQLLLSSASTLRQKDAEEFVERHPTVKYLSQVYGMTELLFCHLPLLGDRISASTGVLAAMYQQKIVDIETNLPCPQGERGEVCVRGAPMTVGYLNKPESTKLLFDEEGWLHTGDLGYIDSNGELHIVERLKELIKISHNDVSLQICPSEIEQLLISHHKIADAAIVGIPDEEREFLIRAYIVRADNTLIEQEVDLFISEHLSDYKRLTGGVRFIDSIPRSESGKLQRRALNNL